MKQKQIGAPWWKKTLTWLGSSDKILLCSRKVLKIWFPDSSFIEVNFALLIASQKGEFPASYSKNSLFLVFSLQLMPPFNISLYYILSKNKCYILTI